MEWANALKAGTAGIKLTVDDINALAVQSGYLTFPFSALEYFGRWAWIVGSIMVVGSLSRSGIVFAIGAMCLSIATIDFYRNGAMWSFGHAARPQGDGRTDEFMSIWMTPPTPDTWHGVLARAESRAHFRHHNLFFFFLLLCTLGPNTIGAAKGTMAPFWVGAWLALFGSFIVPVWAHVRAPKTVFGRPLAPRLSRYGRLHQTWLILLGIGWTWWSIMSLMQSTTVGLGTGFVAVAIMLPASKLFLANATAAIVKGALGHGFRILVFRRFEAESGIPSFKRISATVGSYGTIVTIDDAAIAAARDAIGPVTTAILSDAWFRIARGTSYWKRFVHQELARADLALFFWMSTPTPNMVWEWRAAIRALPTHRMCLVVPSDNAGVMEHAKAADAGSEVDVVKHSAFLTTRQSHQHGSHIQAMGGGQEFPVLSVDPGDPMVRGFAQQFHGIVRRFREEPRRT